MRVVPVIGLFLGQYPSAKLFSNKDATTVSKRKLETLHFFLVDSCGIKRINRRL